MADCAGGKHKMTLMGYAFFACMAILAGAIAERRVMDASGIDTMLHVLDWVPVRLAGVVYALIGHRGD
ncbi:regulatory signaling modulator protein AmpE [Escherichia coli]